MLAPELSVPVGVVVVVPAPIAQAVEPQALLQLDQGIEAAIAPHSAQRRERAADLRHLNRAELRHGHAEQQISP